MTRVVFISKYLKKSDTGIDFNSNQI